ncbi:MAG: type II toxin-antitoxin system mRNA interferase toxin, RelE/StbE family [Thermodesulfovibrionia bacterium]
MSKNIVIPETVLKRINGLPREIRVKFWKKFELLLENPAQPSLRNEKLRGTEDDWVFSITMNYRATYFRDSNNIVITMVGTHKDVLGM